MDPPSRYIENTGAEVDDLDLRQVEVGEQTELQFERFLSETLGGLASGDLKHVNTSIAVALERLSKLLGSDVTTFQQLDKTGVLRHTHQWVNPSLVCDVDFTNEQEYNLRTSTPWLFKELAKGEPIVVLCLDDFPKDAAKEKSLAQNIGFSSIVWVPISADGIVRACLAINSFQQHMHWPHNVLERLRLLGNVFVVALRRAETRQLLNDQLEFERLVSKLSRILIRLPVDEIDSVINDALREIGEYMKVDRVFIDQFSDDKSEFRATHVWTAPGIRRDNLAFEVVVSGHLQWFTKRILSRDPVIFTSADELPREAVNEREYVSNVGIKSSATLPLIVDESVIGDIGVDMIRQEQDWSESTLAHLQLTSEVFASALKRKQIECQLQRAHEEVVELKQRVESENLYLRKEIQLDYAGEGILGNSKAITSVLRQVDQVADTDSAVLISGETGTGKELLAKAIHKLSSRGERTLITVNCAALPATLIEAEMFGREKGAYTGALSKQIGRFELADHSTLFLDEIGDLPLELQPKLLRVLQEGDFERLGSGRTINVDVRVIAATNQDLEKLVRDGRFREDLYYRLNVFPITVPPLRERTEDIPTMVWAFVQELDKKMGRKIDRIPNATMHTLQTYDWPGNVRELRNIVERAMILSSDHVLRADLPVRRNGTEDANQTLQEWERQYIVKTLARTGWRVSGKQGAAQQLGIKPSTLRSRMEKLGIQRPK